MRDFDALTTYAKDKVQATEMPSSLYSKAQLRKSIIDTTLTASLALLVIALSLSQNPPKVTVQSPMVTAYLQTELTASKAEK